MIIDDFVMLGRTEPQQTRNSGVTVCSAGYSPTLGQFIRVYPIAIHHHVPRWSVCRIEVERTSDARSESWSLRNGSIELLRTLSEREQQQLKTELFAQRSASIRELNQQRRSLGVLAPTQLHGAWRSREQAARDYVQLEMDIDTRTQQLYHPDETPTLHILNEDHSRNTLQLRDWGCVEFMRKYVQTGRHRKDELWDALHIHKPQLVFVGNMRHHPTSWLAISIFSHALETQRRTTQTSFI